MISKEELLQKAIKPVEYAKELHSSYEGKVQTAMNILTMNIFHNPNSRPEEVFKITEVLELA